MTLNVVLAFTSKSVPRIKTRSVTFPIVENSRPTDGSFEKDEVEMNVVSVIVFLEEFKFVVVI